MTHVVLKFLVKRKVGRRWGARKNQKYIEQVLTHHIEIVHASIHCVSKRLRKRMHPRANTLEYSEDMTCT